MRRDMLQVVNEPARRRGLPYSSPIEYFEGDVVSPMRESMRFRYRRQYYREPKPQVHSLTPIRRFLERRRGQQWNKVYSELCWSPAGRKHNTLREWAHKLVSTECYLDTDGLVKSNCSMGGVFLAEELEAFFVDPSTGELQSKVPARQELPAEQPLFSQSPSICRRDIGLLTQLHSIDGIWYQVDLGPIPPQIFEAESHLEGVFPSRDVLLGSVYKFRPSALEAKLRARYGRATVWGVKKRQLSSVELKLHGLKNSA